MFVAVIVSSIVGSEDQEVFWLTYRSLAAPMVGRYPFNLISCEASGIVTLIYLFFLVDALHSDRRCSMSWLTSTMSTGTIMR